MVCAEATTIARNLASTRGSEADPEFMEAQIRGIIDGHENVTLEVL